MEVDLTRQSLAFPVKQSHDVGDIRRQAINAGKDLGFDETTNGRVGIVATELAGNLVKHAGGGTIVLRVLGAGSGAGLEIMSLDDGPGMNIDRCMEDGYSTAGSPGTGLGAVNRLANLLDTYSVVGQGSVLVAQMWVKMPEHEAFDIGAVCLPVSGERLCGDGWGVRIQGARLDLVVSDGLGHGPLAAEASDAALEVFGRRPDLSPGSMLETMHAAMRATRGAAVLTGHLDAVRDSLTCAGIGNVAGFVLTTPKAKGVVSMNGIVGHQTTRVKEFSYPCLASDVIVFHSDGLTTHWKLDDFPGLMNRSASVIAGIMYKTFKRGRDDATVLVARRR